MISQGIGLLELGNSSLEVMGAFWFRYRFLPPFPASDFDCPGTGIHRVLTNDSYFIGE